MSPARPLLRLEDKVRSESRRLEVVGAPPPRRAASIAWCVALGAHAVLLALPLAKGRPDLPLRTPRPDLPMVWRPSAPRPSEPASLAAGKPRVSPQPAEAIATVAGPAAFGAEPVPEPAPALSVALIPMEVETLIPAPDTSSEFEPALAPRAVVAAVPILLRKVRPTYPAAARAINANGSVTLEVWIREDGTVGFARVLSCSRPNLGFEQSALLAVREWIYDPAPSGTGTRSVTVQTDFQREERRP